MGHNLDNRKKKIEFLAGLKARTRSVDELVELEVVFTDRSKFEKALKNGRYEGRTIFFIPDNGRTGN